MIDVNELFPSRYLNTGNLPRSGEVYEIARVWRDTIGRDKQQKLMVALVGVDPVWPLNKINFTVLLNAFGPDERHWIGQSVILDVMDVPFGGEMKSGIRVRIPKPAAGPAAKVPRGSRPEPEPAVDGAVPPAGDPDWAELDN